jgi:acetyl esterase/lipase
MSTEAMQTQPFSRQLYLPSTILTGDRVKCGILLTWAVMLILGATFFHFLGAPGQWSQSIPLTIVLFAGAIIQLASVLLIVIFPTRRAVSLAAIINGVAVLVWIVSHTIGLPIGLTLWQPEMLAISDYFLPVMEGLGALLLLGLVLRRPKVRKSRMWLSVLGTVLAALPILLIVSMITWIGSLTWLGPNPAASEAWFSSSASIHAPAGQMTTVSYCSRDGHPLSMDLSEPAAQTARPAPVVFYIHGGEALTGYRQLELNQPDTAYLVQLRSNLLNHGFVVGSINYSLAPLHKTNEQIQDAKCAVRFLRAHASDLGIDPQRIGIYGFSQGGYLASMLGTVGPEAGYDVGQYTNQSSRVQAVISISGISDLSNFSGSPRWINTLGSVVGGSKSNANAKVAALRSASPLYHVAAGDPPFMLIHGAQDWFIAPHHAQDMAKRLQGAGVPTTLVIVQHDGHGLSATTPGQVEQPSPNTLVQMMTDFFVKNLAS